MPSPHLQSEGPRGSPMLPKSEPAEGLIGTQTVGAGRGCTAVSWDKGADLLAAALTSPPRSLLGHTVPSTRPHTSHTGLWA